MSRNVTVYLIRHGESTSNVEFKIFLEFIVDFISLKRTTIPMRRFLWALFRLTIGYEFDSELSELGRKQALNASSFLKEEISSVSQPKIVHSALKRAILTAQLMTNAESSYLSLPELNEASQIEHIFESMVRSRINSFETWLVSSSSGEITPTFFIFGHAQYFKYLLKKSEEMRNCDVWRITAQIDSSSETVKWTEPVLEYRSPFSYLHPIQTFKSTLFKKMNTDLTTGSESHTSSEQVCRICQLTALESSEPLIRPCQCRGTISSVHVSCLNQWRSTSSVASYQCSICKYRYNIQRTTLSAFFTSELGVHCLTSFLFFFLLLVNGIIMKYISSFVEIDILLYITTHFFHWNSLWWRMCPMTIPVVSFHFLPHFFSQANLWYYQQTIFHEYLPLSVIDRVVTDIVCHYIVINIMEYLISGLLSTGFITVTVSFVWQGTQLCQQYQRNYQEFLRNQQNVLVFIVWLASLNHERLSKFCVIFGIAVIARKIYDAVQIYGRLLAQSIGETILEPNN